MDEGAMKEIKCWYPILTDKELKALCAVSDKVRLGSELVNQFLGEQGLFVGTLDAYLVDEDLFVVGHTECLSNTAVIFNNDNVY